MAEEAKVEEKKEEAASVAAPEATPAVEAAPTAAAAAVVGGTKKVNWVLALVLSILVGQLGVDRFIMGQIGWGILKLITLGGFGIWWIIDIILIATKHPFPGVEWVE